MLVETKSEQRPVSAAEIGNWLVAYLADLLEMDPDDLDVNAPVAGYGVDSSGAVGLAGDLSQFLGRELEAELVYKFPTIQTLAAHLAQG
jgi:acyl carrier protein